MGVLEWRNAFGFYLSFSSVIVAGRHGFGSIFGNCYTILMLSSWYLQGSSQMLFLLEREKNKAYRTIDPLEQCFKKCFAQTIKVNKYPWFILANLLLTL